ncbi:MAG: MtrB/PioB family decaheme-associated outer membrane protein [candidate division NC10 bacterium]|nr:MtrB/PioB family decaheme-associated outer membrane protein [candidate division NC10 bacterium]
METGRRLLPLGAALALALGPLLVSGPSPARAESDLGPVVLTGEVEVGGRGVSGDWGSSEYEEYREQRPGIFGNARLLLEGKEGKYYFEGSATDIAERDQHYEVASGRYGRYRLELEFDEFVHVFSNTARTLYTNEGGGVLSFPDATQSTIEGLGTNALKSAALQSALSGATGVPLRFRLQTGRVGLFYRPLAELEVNAGYWVQEKEGTRPFGMGFGSPGGTFVNVAAPIDERTHEVTGGIQVARDTWSLRLDYTGSFYENDLDTMTVDNPLQAAPDAVAGPSRGRTDLAPDNSAHTVSLSAAVTLPVGFPARFAGTFSYGMRFQDDAFIPHTINSAISDPSLTLPASSLDAEVRTLLANLVLTGRPSRELNLTARYRFYDYNSDIPILAFPGHVINDQGAAVVETRLNTPMDHHIHNASLDASYRLARPTTLKLGYEWERWDRSEHREVTRTDEHTAKAAVDYKPATWALLRVGYRFGIRRGTDYSTFAHLAHTIADEADFSDAVLTSQSTLLRKFDEGDRNRHQADLMAQLSPREDLTLTFTGGYGLTDYNNPPLGLVEDERWSVGTDIGYRPLSWLALSTWYTFENIQFKQDSRWRAVVSGAAVDDPVNNWSSTSQDLVHTAGVGAEMVLIPDRLDASLSYVLEIAKAKTLAQGIAGTTSATNDGGNAVDWPDIKDTLQTFIAALRYHLQKNLTVKAEYRFEHFNLSNFKTDGLEPFMANSNVNGSGTVSPSLDVFLGDRVDDYVAHIIALSLIYRF